MTAPVRIWLEVAHHAAFRIGGWAFVRSNAGAVSGSAGGQPRIDPERNALAAITAALAGLPEGASVELHSASPLVLASSVQRVGLVMRPVEVSAGSPSAFTAAWAEFALGRAKDRGAFSAPIPKSNLAKAGV